MSKSFLRGISIALNLFPQERGEDLTLPTYSSNEEALQHDLEQVGSDIKFSIKIIEQPKRYLGYNFRNK